jgi:hypothetical protein
VNELETTIYLSGPYDKNGAFVTVYSGAGGTEAMDWAEILLRMYTRYFERKGWKVSEVYRLNGEEAGIKTATLKVEGLYAYGLLKQESGTHRLVRLSPFNAQNLRQTSFSGAEGLQFLSKFMKPGMRYALEGLDRYLPGAKAHGETASNFVKTVDDFIRKFDVDLTKGAAETMDADISLGLRTTGRAEPLTLNEKMAYQAVIADPLNSNATVLRIQLNDPRWPASQGWVKMAQNIRGIEIHYNYNTITGAIDDIKFIFIDL